MKYNPVFVPPEELAIALNISVSRIHQLRREGVLPTPERAGSWDLIATTRAYIKHRLQPEKIAKEKATSEGNTEDYWKEKTRLTRLQADKEALAIAEKEGRLVDAEQVQQQWADLIVNCKSRLLMMPTKLAYEIAAESNPNVCLDMLTKAVYEALDELSQMGDDEKPV